MHLFFSSPAPQILFMKPFPILCLIYSSLPFFLNFLTFYHMTAFIMRLHDVSDGMSRDDVPTWLRTGVRLASVVWVYKFGVVHQSPLFVLSCLSPHTPTPPHTTSSSQWRPNPRSRQDQVLRSKGLKVRRARVVLRRKWSQGTGTLNDVGSALESLPKTNVLG